MPDHEFPCVESNTNLVLPDGVYYEEVEYVNSIELCIQACFDRFQNSPCVGYTWIPEDHRCWLKDSGYSRDNLLGVYSGEIENCIMPDIPKHCFENDIDFYGYDLELIYDVETVEKCLKLCKANLNCFGFSYGNQILHQRCYLKKKNAHLQRSPYIGFISGLIENCGPSLPRSCFQTGYNIPANLLLFVDNVATPGLCIQICKTYQSCKAITWLNEDFVDSNYHHRCYLKSIVGPLEAADAGVVVGILDECEYIPYPNWNYCKMTQKSINMKVC